MTSKFQSIDPDYREPPMIEQFRASLKLLPTMTENTRIVFDAMLERIATLEGALKPFALFGIDLADARFMGNKGAFQLTDDCLYYAVDVYGKEHTYRDAVAKHLEYTEAQEAAAERSKALAAGSLTVQ